MSKEHTIKVIRRIATVRNLSRKQTAQLDTEQGNSEQWTEPYIQYGEGIAEQLTQLCVRSSDGTGSTAARQVATVRSLQCSIL